LPNKQINHKRDFHYKQAKKEGYRARSAYKLIDIQKRYNIFKRAFYILDLGCAPGSWLQVAKSNAESNLIKYNDVHYHRDHYKILGVDTKNVFPIENIQTLKTDLRNPEINAKIKSNFQNKLDLILSDASINKSGNKFSDHLRQNKLCYSIVDIAKHHLKFKGILVMKAFQGIDFVELVRNFKNEFKISKTYKPQASKKKSNEIYLIGIQKKN